MSGGHDRDGASDQERTKSADRERTDAGGGEPGKAVEPRPPFYCDVCGNVMIDLHCKLICERCGYKRDCSDP